MTAVQSSGSGISFLLAVAFFFRQWEVPSGSGNFLTSSGNALCILFPTVGANLVYLRWNLSSLRYKHHSSRTSLEVYALVSTHKVAKELWERIQMLMQGTYLTKQEKE
nr:hypothetical protein [Tanacetum cinerariifolium]